MGQEQRSRLGSKTLMKALGPLVGLSGGQGQSWGTLTVFKKLEEKEERDISSHRYTCKDIKLDPSRISDPAIMGQLLGETIVPSFSSVQGLSKIPTNCEKVHIENTFLHV